MKQPVLPTKPEIIKNIDLYVVGRNAARDRAILYRRYIDGLSYDKLASEFELTPRHIQNIVYKYQYKVLGL